MKELTKCIRTDLAYDDKDNDENRLNEIIEVVDDIEIYKHIIDDANAKKFNKKSGTYYTVDLNNIDIRDTKTEVTLEKVLAKVLKNIYCDLNLKNKKCLIVGLGNMNVTPDSLGPYVVDNIIVTRHLFELNSISDGFSNVSAISPGVMGTTGIETYDIIDSVVRKIKCDFVIAIDALATSKVSRVNKTIQIADSGINPGSGVGNKRKELSMKTLGIPVIAIGVPTVVDSVTITNDVIEHVLNYLEKINETELLGEFGMMDEELKKSLIKDILDPRGFNMMVTPKEIDADIEDLTKIIANAIDLSLHQGLFNGFSE